MLTDERALELWGGPGNRQVIGKYKVIAFARAIEAEVLQSQNVGGITPFNPLNAASNVLPCRTQNAECATQDGLLRTDATQQGAQEPVAWRWLAADGYQFIYDERMLSNLDTAIHQAEPLYTAPPPPAPCPNCRQHELDFALEHDDKLELQAKVAELEKVAKAYEDQVAAHNKTLDEVARLSAMIEKCEKALARHVPHESFKAFKEDGRWFIHSGDDICEVSEQAIELDALAAIAAQKGGA